jgi:RNA polymerase sigma-70 factor (ECF subfamily)
MTVIEGFSLALAPTMTVRSQVDLTVIVDSHSALLFRVAHSILRNRAEAEDTVQDTFVRVLQHRHLLDTIEDLRVWLVRITWNLALDRKRRIRPGQFDPGFVETLIARNLPADRQLAEQRTLQATLSAIDALPKIERSVLLLSALDELDTVSIAAVLNKSPSAVRALLHRARTRLRQRLQASLLNKGAIR